ncbi:MAG: hypothetical protein JEZ09_19535 [Salinivirgaceae bacterium]|nr:hypothetical protein [Salinivirgaceae bacterium]
MIESINLRSLRSGEFTQFTNDVMAILAKADTETLGIKDQAADFNTAVEQLQAGFNKERGSDITAELTEIDARRDACISGIEKLSEAYTLHFEPVIAKAAQELLHKIESYGPRIAKQNYQTETTIINNLTQAVETDADLKDAVSKLYLSDWFDQLKKENNWFSQRFLDRIDEEAQQSDEKFKELRDTASEAYRTLCMHITAHVTLKGIAGYDAIINQLNSLIDAYNLTLKRRATTDEVV